MLNMLEVHQQRSQGVPRLLRSDGGARSYAGDVQLARRFDVLTMPRWAADESFEELIRAILRNQPMREKSVLTAKSLRHIFVTTDGVTARIFRMMNALAIAAIESGLERITDEAVLAWRPLINGEAAFV